MNNLVRREGFEPPTHALEGHCSIQLSYRRTRFRQDKILNVEFYSVSPVYSRMNRLSSRYYLFILRLSLLSCVYSAFIT